MEKMKENKPDLADLIRQNKKRHFSPTSDEKSSKDSSSANSAVHRDRKSLIPTPKKSSKSGAADENHISDSTSDRSSPLVILSTCSNMDEMCRNQSPKSEVAHQPSNQANEMSDFEKRLLIAAKGSILNVNGTEPVAPAVGRGVPPDFSGGGLFPPFFGFGSLQMMPFAPPCQTQVFGPPTARAGHDSNKFLPADEHQKKKGKWCAMHVKLAWEIYHNAQYRKDRKKMKMMALAARRSEKKRKSSENGSSECGKESDTKNEDDLGKVKKMEENASTSSTDCNSQASRVDNDRPSSPVSIPPKNFSTGRDAAHLNIKSKSNASETTESGRNEDHRRNHQHHQQQTSFLMHNFHHPPQNPPAAQDFYVKSLLMNQFLHHQNLNRQFMFDQHQQQQRLLYQQNTFDGFSTTAYPPPLLNQQDQHQRDLIATSLLFQQMPRGFYGFRQQQTAPFLPS